MYLEPVSDFDCLRVHARFSGAMNLFVGADDRLSVSIQAIIGLNGWSICDVAAAVAVLAVTCAARLRKADQSEAQYDCKHKILFHKNLHGWFNAFTTQYSFDVGSASTSFTPAAH